MNSDGLLTAPAKRAGFRLGARRFSVAQFLAATVLLIVTSPFVQRIEHGKFIEDTLFTVAMLFAVLAVGGSRRTLLWGIVLVVPMLMAHWARESLWAGLAPGAGTFPALLFVLFVVAHLLRFILRAPRVDSEVLCAGIVTYLMLGLLWAIAYALVYRLAPGSFAFTPAAKAGQVMDGFTAMYFSFITLSTVGYGDFVPLSPAARMLVMTEAVTGTLYLAVLISRLVSLHASAPPPRSRE